MKNTILIVSDTAHKCELKFNEVLRLVQNECMRVSRAHMVIELEHTKFVFSHLQNVKITLRGLNLKDAIIDENTMVDEETYRYIVSRLR